jgi:hypothetical protein
MSGETFRALAYLGFLYKSSFFGKICPGGAGTYLPEKNLMKGTARK